MPLKSNPKYKIDRRRTHRKSSVTEPSDSEEYSAASENEEEYDTEDSDEKPPARSTRRSPRRSMSSTGSRRKSQRGEGGGVLANLPAAGSRTETSNGTKPSKEAVMDNDDSEEEDVPSDNANDDDSDYDDVDEEEEEDDDDEEEKDKEIDELLQNQSRTRPRRNNTRTVTKRAKRKKAAHSSDEEFVLDSDDDDDSSRDLSTSEHASAKFTEDDSIFGDPDLSEDESEVVVTKRNGKKDAVIGDVDDDDENVVNVDDEQIGTIDDESDSDGAGDEMVSPNGPIAMGRKEILPSPKGIENNFAEDSKTSAGSRHKAVCPKCPSTEDAVTLEPLTRVHVCYIAPDGKSRVCFNLETLRQIALKSSQLALRVDIDATRKNFLQPPAFRTPMSDDLVDQIASKFGRGALDLEGPYYTNREAKYDRKYGGEDDDYSFDSDIGMENIYDTFEIFHERVKNYFRNGMGSQDLYVCPICYGKIHRSLGTKPAAACNKDTDDSSDDDDTAAAIEEYDAAPSDSVYDPITVLGYLDNDEMAIASQFCFKRLADVKQHLRQDHNVDIRGIQGNELYKRFRVRAPDGLLQRWLSTQVRGQVKQGHMRMYWGEGNDQIFIQLLDLMERVRAYVDGALSDQSDDSSEEDGNEMDRYASKARKFFDSFAFKAHHWWKLISSPFLKSNENLNDFIAKDDDEDYYYSEEEDSRGQHQHAAIHQQLMNEDSDENDLVHKLQRKYAEPSHEESSNSSSSTEEELEFVDKEEESGDDDYNRNGYYSPVEEEKDEWMLKLQSQRKRKGSSIKKEKSTNDKLKTPTTGKKLFRRKTPTPSAIASSSKTSSSKKRRTLTLDDSSDED